MGLLERLRARVDELGDNGYAATTGFLTAAVMAITSAVTRDLDVGAVVGSIFTGALVGGCMLALRHIHRAEGLTDWELLKHPPVRRSFGLFLAVALGSLTLPVLWQTRPALIASAIGLALAAAGLAWRLLRIAPSARSGAAVDG